MLAIYSLLHFTCQNFQVALIASLFYDFRNCHKDWFLHGESKWWKWLDMCIKHLTECWWNVLLKEQSGHDLCQGYWISEWASQQNRDTLKTTIWKELYDKCHNIARRTWVLFQYSSENG